jgi:hypothetical protein
MLDFCRLIFGIASDLLRSQVALEAEILVLRQQINVLRRANPKRLRFVSIDRLILGGVCRLFPKMYGALAIVRPETVIRWHRAGFRSYWRWKSTPSTRGAGSQSFARPSRRADFHTANSPMKSLPITRHFPVRFRHGPVRSRGVASRTTMSQPWNHRNLAALPHSAAALAVPWAPARGHPGAAGQPRARQHPVVAQVDGLPPLVRRAPGPRRRRQAVRRPSRDEKI